MEFFEVLLILVFIGLPLLEGILKRRRAAGEADTEAEPTPGRRPGPPAPRPEPSPRDTGAWPDQEEDDAAAAMVPDDLWELLTGERRRTEATPETPSRGPEEGRWPGEAEPIEEGAIAVEAEPHWEVEQWEPEPVEPTRPPRREPESVEYTGPEVVSLETPPPPPEVRHRAFHERLDSFEQPPQRRAPAAAAGLQSALGDPAGLRRAIILAEVLGPPKGLGDPDGPRGLAD